MQLSFLYVGGIIMTSSLPQTMLAAVNGFEVYGDSFAKAIKEAEVYMDSVL
jgi:hypothetical protein